MLVVGGRQRAPRGMRELGEGWYGYACGVALRVDHEGVRQVLEYESPAGTHAPGDPVLFKSAEPHGDELWCCTQTEVVVLDRRTLAVRRHLSLPIFNDVHHVLPLDDGSMLVAVSGLELVVQLDADGQVVQQWDVLGERTWDRHDPAVDYRQGVDLKPHRAHPNHLFVLDGEPWATRFELRDAISLVDPRRRISPGGERLHDGVVHDGRVWFTAVDGEVVAADAATLEVVERHRLSPPGGGDALLGWCRGLYFDDDGVWVGFSRIRFTNLRQTVSWIRHRGTAAAPTRIAHYRLDDWTCDAEIDLEPAGLNAVFSVVPT